MIRASLGDQSYWDQRKKFREETIAQDIEQISKPPGNPMYRPQFVFDLSKSYPRQIITCYSRGDPIPELSVHFAGLLDAWELSNKLSDELCKARYLKTCRDWTFELDDLNHYNWCFWLVGLALTLNVPDDQWDRLVMLIGAAGQDELLDRLMATRQKDRVVGTGLLHPKPYARLLKAIDAPKEQQPELLYRFVDNWYPELARKGKDELWWYIYGDPVKHPLKMGSYFGRWCIEAAVAAKVFDINDSLCQGHEHYPGDLVRPNGASTHTKRPEAKPGLLKMLFGGKR